MDEIKQAKLRKMADEILLGGKKAVEGFNYDNYTKEELEFLMQEIDERNTQDLDKFMQNLN
ncbi:hypothetical protein AGMMS50293_14800 [Spirochaetia bacterium]|nr:hypothetical protein AGMMS50293_14800 [Spirochaetia bacterium]